MTKSNIRRTFLMGGNKIQSFNTVIPSDLVKKYNIKEGDWLQFEDLGDGIKIVPLVLVKKFS